jgi:hypothetical protein
MFFRKRTPQPAHPPEETDDLAEWLELSRTEDLAFKDDGDRDSPTTWTDRSIQG